MAKTPLAWKNLTHDRRRLVLASGGIGFAVLLVFIEIGFLYALLDSTVQVIEVMDADLIIVSKALHSLPAQQRFDRRRLYQARSCPGVATYPVYTETFYGILKQHHAKGYPIRVIAFDPRDPVFRLPAVQGQLDELGQPATALFDVRSKPIFGLAVTDRLDAQRVELADQNIRLAGTFSLGTDFANEGNLIMSAKNFARYFPQRAFGADPLSMVDLGVVQLEAGLDRNEAKRCLQQLLPRDVNVFTKEEFIQRERIFWSTNTPVGYIFTVGAVMGFIVGVVICYQVIYSDIADHLAEFATLKAMGYRNSYFAGLVIVTSLYLSLLGFVPGALISWGLYRWLAEYTGLAMSFTPLRGALVLLLTMAMCAVSGALALRKLLSADPAELF